jgi:NTE family protein
VTTALVLSAGGMFAAWEAGVWKSLSGRFRPDLIVGASAGAWNGWAIAGGCSAEDLIHEWMDSATARIGLFRAEALDQRARELFLCYQPRIPFGLTVVEVPRLRARLVSGSAITWRHLAATCAIPFGFPAVRIQGRRYVDGGLLGGLPLWAAEEMGATRAIAVNALTTLPFRMLHEAMRGRRASAALEVIRIEPSTQLGSLRDAVCWSRANVERWIEQGERDANRVATSITM